MHILSVYAWRVPTLLFGEKQQCYPINMASVNLMMVQFFLLPGGGV